MGQLELEFGWSLTKGPGEIYWLFAVLDTNITWNGCNERHDAFAGRRQFLVPTS